MKNVQNKKKRNLQEESVTLIQRLCATYTANSNGWGLYKTSENLSDNTKDKELVTADFLVHLYLESVNNSGWYLVLFSCVFKLFYMQY